MTSAAHAGDALQDGLSAFARELIAEARQDLGPEGPADHHVHIGGLGSGAERIAPTLSGAGVWLHPDYRSWRNPWRRIQSSIFFRASGIHDRGDADAEYIEALFDLASNSGVGGTYMLYALDWRYEPAPANREPNRDKTDLFVDNRYVMELARCLNERAAGAVRFVPVVSVHPYRADAIDAVAELAAQGARHLKWLPPAQNIDPAEPSLRPFYRALQRLGMVLFSHTGNEHTIRVSDRNQDLGDPVRLAPALEEGVTVLMLHAARDGVERMPAADGMRKSYADRFFEMMRTHGANLFGEISVLPYLGTHVLLERLLAEPGVAERLVNGSDYPAPAIPGIDPTGRLFRAGYLRDASETDETPARKRRDALKEIRRHNPLLFDFVLKRTIRVNGRRLPASIFRSIDSKLSAP